MSATASSLLAASGGGPELMRISSVPSHTFGMCVTDLFLRCMALTCLQPQRRSSREHSLLYYVHVADMLTPAQRHVPGTTLLEDHTTRVDADT